MKLAARCLLFAAMLIFAMRTACAVDARAADMPTRITPTVPDLAFLPRPLVTCLFDATDSPATCPAIQIVPFSNPSSKSVLQPETSWALALSCTNEESTLPKLPGLNYGSGGPFAISLWFKQDRVAEGSELATHSQFLFSHAEERDINPRNNPISRSRSLRHGLDLSSTCNDCHETAEVVGPHTFAHDVHTPIRVTRHANHSTVRSSFSNNQVHVFLPTGAAAGVVRTLVRDSMDIDQPASFFDTDGMLNNFDGVRNEPNLKQVKHDEWHHLVLTTHPVAGTKGYALFFDGALSAFMHPPTAASDMPTMPVTGGGHMHFNGSHIHLCQGADANPATRFRGHLSHLRIYNASLTATDVKSLFLADAGDMTPAGRRRLAARSLLPTDTPSQLQQQQQPAASPAPEPATPTAATPSSSASTNAPASLDVASDKSTVFSFLNGELAPGVRGHSGHWATMTDDIGSSQVPSGKNTVLAMLACDGSSSSAVPLPITAPQPLPLLGFSVTAWVRVPSTALLAVAEGPVPIFSLITTQQMALTSSPVIDSPAGTRRSSSRRLARSDVPVFIPTSVHAYLAPGNVLNVAINVAVVTDALASVTSGQRFAPTEATYHAQVNMARLADAGMHHFALVAAPPNNSATQAGVGDVLAYSVFMDGTHQAIAVAAPPATTVGRRLRADSMSGTQANMDDWLVGRAAAQLEAMAADGKTGLLLLCGSNRNSTSSNSSISPAAGSTAPGPSRRQHLNEVITKRVSSSPAVAGRQQSASPEPPAASPAGPTLPPLLPHSQSRKSVLVTDLRLFSDPLTDVAVHMLWAVGPGYQAPSASDAGQAPAAFTTMPSTTSTPAATAPARIEATTGTMSPLWVQIGSGFVPRYSGLYAHRMTTRLPEDSLLESDDLSAMERPAGSISEHVVSVVLPEDALLSGSQLSSGLGFLSASKVASADNADDQGFSRGAKLGLGLGLGLGLIAAAVVGAVLLIGVRRYQAKTGPACVQLSDSGGARDAALLPSHSHTTRASNVTLLLDAAGTPTSGATGTPGTAGVKASGAAFVGAVVTAGTAAAKQLAGLLPSPSKPARATTRPSACGLVSKTSDELPSPDNTQRDVETPRSQQAARSELGSTGASKTSLPSRKLVLPGAEEPVAGARAQHGSALAMITSPRLRGNASAMQAAGSAHALGSPADTVKRALGSSFSRSNQMLQDAEDTFGGINCMGRMLPSRLGKSGYFKAESDKSMILMPQNFGGPVNPATLRNMDGDTSTPLATGSRAAGSSMALADSVTAAPGNTLRGHSMTAPRLHLGLDSRPLHPSRLSSFSGAVPAMPEGTKAVAVMSPDYMVVTSPVAGVVSPRPVHRAMFSSGSSRGGDGKHALGDGHVKRGSTGQQTMAPGAHHPGGHND